MRRTGKQGCMPRACAAHGQRSAMDDGGPMDFPEGIPSRARPKAELFSHPCVQSASRRRCIDEGIPDPNRPNKVRDPNYGIGDRSTKSSSDPVTGVILSYW
jgi:hypothetical protein